MSEEARDLLNQPPGFERVPTSEDTPPVHVMIFDTELESSMHGVYVDDPETFPISGVEQSESAVGLDVEVPETPGDILDPFVRSIEVLLRSLAPLLGETGAPATIRLGSTVIEYAAPGVGDDAVRIYRTARNGDGRRGHARRRGTEEPAVLRQAVGHWELGISAAREGNHALALEAFEEEARTSEAEEAHQRAAIAYRSASREAGLLGRRDYSNKLLRLAGKHYLFVSEDSRTTVRGRLLALVTSAKCFLQAGNWALAETCIARARSASNTLGGGELPIDSE
ncbi:MAG: hypothetical protein ACRDV4_06725 [Acidimicrobiales bacterium]